MIFRRAGWSDYFLYYENWRAQSDDDAFAAETLRDERATPKEFCRTMSA